MKYILRPGEGEGLKLGPPARGEVIIAADPRHTALPFVMGIETLLPGAEIPLHRHRREAEVWFVHKGQGRATVEGESMPVVPGAVIVTPRDAWHMLRNTGTGILQVAWVAAPGGIEGFFREISRGGVAAPAPAIQEIAQRYGLEFRPEGGLAAPLAPGRRRRRRRRGGRHPSSQEAPQGVPPAEPRAAEATPAAASAPLPQPSAISPTAPPPGGRRRRRRRRRGRAGSTTAPARPAPASAGPIGGPAVTSPSRRSLAPRQGGREGSAKARAGGTGTEAAGTGRVTPRSQRGRRHRAGRMKEVYMGGRWIRVVGEGPVISPGSGESQPRAPRTEDDPSGPFSVPL